VARFKKEPPYAWIVPEEQWDPPTASLLLNNLTLLGIDIYTADKAFVATASRTRPGRGSSR